MDRHFLNPLFVPRSIVVFAGDPEVEPAPTPLAATLRRHLGEGGFGGPVTWLDVAMTGTLSELAHSRADLALVALPAEQAAAAMEIVGRIRCRAALVLCTGMSAALCSELHQIARHYGVQLLGPNSLGFQRPELGLNASALGPLAAVGQLGLVDRKSVV